MRLTLRIDFSEERQFGPGKARLLELVAEHGSITAAGRAMNMSYRQAWLLIDDINSMFATRLVEARPGGPGGGGATLTDLGRDVLATYRRIETHAQATADLEVLQGYLAPQPKDAK
jgi:molybdate transport system regulatory protein